MSSSNPPAFFYLIVTDHDRGVFAVEGPTIDDRPWQSAPQYACNASASHHLRTGRP
jgi:hypothetical protein